MKILNSVLVIVWNKQWVAEVELRSKSRNSNSSIKFSTFIDQDSFYLMILILGHSIASELV